MSRQPTYRELSRLRDTLHGPAAPTWMRNVLVTGVGPKISNKIPEQGVRSIHFVVRKKQTRGTLTKRERIPKFLDGIPTDVVSHSGELNIASAPVPAVQAELGFGAPLVTVPRGSTGTAAFAGTGAAAAAAILATSAHVVDLGEAVALGSGARPAIGPCIGRLDVVDGRKLYGGLGSAPAGPHLVDCATIRIDNGTPSAGLPAGRTFVTGDTARVDQWVFADTPLVAWGSASGQWRHGHVLHFWPCRSSTGLYSLCTIEQQPISDEGDSGGAWLAYTRGSYVLLGLHWGKIEDDASDSPVAIVTDITACLAALGVRQVLGG